MVNDGRIVCINVPARIDGKAQAGNIDPAHWSLLLQIRGISTGITVIAVDRMAFTAFVPCLVALRNQDRISFTPYLDDA